MPEPVRRQRLGAYAALLRGPEGAQDLLITRIAAHAYGAGQWNLPGGGVDHGENPRDTVRRELFEEAGLRVRPGRVLDVLSQHIVADSPTGVLEDYHGVQLIFAANIAEGVDEPMITDASGTTDAVAWVPADDLCAGRHPSSFTIWAALRGHGYDTARAVKRTGISAADVVVHCGWRDESSADPVAGEFWIDRAGTAYERTCRVTTASRSDGQATAIHYAGEWRSSPDLDGCAAVGDVRARLKPGVRLTDGLLIPVYADRCGPFADQS